MLPKVARLPSHHAWGYLLSPTYIITRCTQIGIKKSLVHACLIHSNSSCRAPRLGRCIRIYLKRCFLGSRIKPLCSPIAWGRVRAVKNGRGLYRTKWLSLDPRLPLHCCLHPKMRIPPSTAPFQTISSFSFVSFPKGQGRRKIWLQQYHDIFPLNLACFTHVTS